ncbi:MAG: hypothetical protein Q4A34_00100 [Candidatus Saccharibacteria bacterium]|nr:hypothetical protein [Candidatus Saccharibacteria bacterium]
MERLTYTLFTPDTRDRIVENSGHSSGLAVFSRAQGGEARLYIATHNALHHTHLFQDLLNEYPELREERQQWDNWGGNHYHEPAYALFIGSDEQFDPMCLYFPRNPNVPERTHSAIDIPDHKVEMAARILWMAGCEAEQSKDEPVAYRNETQTIRLADIPDAPIIRRDK